MEKKDRTRLELTLICGSLLLSAVYLNNPTINGISFRSILPDFLNAYHPLLVVSVFVMCCIGLAFLSCDKTIPQKKQKTYKKKTVDKSDPDVRRWHQLAKEHR